VLAASHVRPWERASTTAPVQDRPVLESGFHRLTLVFGLASVAVNDALLTGVFILGWLVLGIYALIAFDGAPLAMVTLSGAEIFGAGIRER
jgi:hypothetical protein